jgi:hypothetical protein
MSSGSNSKATGCVSLVIILLIIAFFGWLLTPNINNDEKVISAIQGGWTVQEKSGGYFYNIKIEIDGNNFKAWRKMELTDTSIDDWGQPDCEGTFTLGPVQTYSNAADEFRHISWNNCIDIHSAYYSNTGMYWGEWGPMSATSRGFWYGFKWFLYIVGTGFLVFFIMRWRMNKVNQQNIPTDEINEKNKNLSENQIKALSRKAKLVKCESCGYYPVEYGYICTKCGTLQSKGNQPEEIQKHEKIIDPIKKKKNNKIAVFSILGISLIAVSIFVINYIVEENERKEAEEKARAASIENAKKAQAEKDIITIEKYLGTYINEIEIGSDSASGFEIIENQGLFSVVPSNSDKIGRWLLIKFDEKSNSVFATKNGSKDTVKFADIINDYTLSIANKNYINASSNHYANLISENVKVVLDSIKTKTIKAANYLSYQKYKSGIDESNYYSISSDLINSSSNLKQQGNNSYGVENLADDYFSTAWVEGLDGNGIGERIEFSYDLTYDGGFIDSVLLIANGYQSTNAAFLNNSRVKQIKISHDKKLLYVVDLKDEMGLQKIVLTGISKYFQLYMKYGVNKSKNIQLQLEISDVFKGKKYEDTAITDIYFVSQNGQ